MRTSLKLLGSSVLGCVSLVAQQRVDPRFTHFRALCILPLVGGGAAGEVRRPDHLSSLEAGLASDAASPGRRKLPDGILGFYQEISDDGNWALVEIVASSREALEPMLADKRPGVWCVVKGTVGRNEVELRFRRLKKDFDISHFGANVR